jgi:hypothetical protein
MKEKRDKEGRFGKLSDPGRHNGRANYGKKKEYRNQLSNIINEESRILYI